jgi:hypothetical protein
VIVCQVSQSGSIQARHRCVSRGRSLDLSAARRPVLQRVGQDRRAMTWRRSGLAGILDVRPYWRDESQPLVRRHDRTIVVEHDGAYVGCRERRRERFAIPQPSSLPCGRSDRPGLSLDASARSKRRRWSHCLADCRLRRFQRVRALARPITATKEASSRPTLTRARSRQWEAAAGRGIDRCRAATARYTAPSPWQGTWGMAPSAARSSR